MGWATYTVYLSTRVELQPLPWINSVQLAACTVQPAICPARGASEYAVGEKRSPSAVSLSACPVLIGGREPVAGNGGPSRLFGLPGDGHYRRHSMAVCATIFTPQGSSLCAEGHFSKVCACVERLYVCSDGGIKDRSPGNSLFITEVLDTEINTGWEGGNESFCRSGGCWHFHYGIWTWGFGNWELICNSERGFIFKIHFKVEYDLLCVVHTQKHILKALTHRWHDK